MSLEEAKAQTCRGSYVPKVLLNGRLLLISLTRHLNNLENESFGNRENLQY